MIDAKFSLQSINGILNKLGQMINGGNDTKRPNTINYLKLSEMKSESMGMDTENNVSRDGDENRVDGVNEIQTTIIDFYFLIETDKGHCILKEICLTPSKSLYFLRLSKIMNLGTLEVLKIYYQKEDPDIGEEDLAGIYVKINELFGQSQIKTLWYYQSCPLFPLLELLHSVKSGREGPQKELILKAAVEFKGFLILLRRLNQNNRVKRAEIEVSEGMFEITLDNIMPLKKILRDLVIPLRLCKIKCVDPIVRKELFLANPKVIYELITSP